MVHTQGKEAINRNHPPGSLDVGITRQRFYISRFKYVQRNKGNYVKIIKGKYNIYHQIENSNKEVAII